MKNKNIICFAKEWSEDPTSNNHILLSLARENKIVWLNSISMRRPIFRSTGDLSKLWRKLKSIFRRREHSAYNLWVVTPIVLPFPHSKIAIRLNICILKGIVGYYKRKLNMHEFQLWTFLPTAVEYVGHLGESLVVYYCTDEWSQFSYLEGEKISAMERRLMQKADVCFMTARSLFETKKHSNPNTFIAPHGVDYNHFAKALTPTTLIPSEVRNLPHPIIGFVGLIQEWIDLDLLAMLATRHTRWSLILIGKSVVDTSVLSQLKNVYCLGRRPYDTLPGYCRAFDVGIIPFKVNELTRHVNPIKLREYLSAGLPVVSTDLPDVKFYSKGIYIGRNHEEFISKVREAISEDSAEARRQRSDSMRWETWEARTAAITRTIDQICKAKRR